MFAYRVFKPQSGKSWYAGTWPRAPKAMPSTKIAKENPVCLSTSGEPRQAQVARSPTASTRTQSSYFPKSFGGATRALPLTAATSKINVTSSRSNSVASQTTRLSQGSGVDLQDTNASRKEEGEQKADIPVSDQSSQPENQEHKTKTDNPEHILKQDNTYWFRWILRSQSSDPEATSSPAPDQSSSAVPDPVSNASEMQGVEGQGKSPIPQDEPVPSDSQDQRSSQRSDRRSWFGLWNTVNNQSEEDATINAGRSADLSERVEDKISEPNIAQEGDSIPVETSDQIIGDSRSSGWAFWSRSRPQNEKKENESENDVGELALAGSPSQAKPEKAVLDGNKSVPETLGKGDCPQSLEVSNNVKPPNSTNPQADQILNASSGKSQIAKSKTKQISPNLLLPSFQSTFRSGDKHSLLQQLSRFFPFNYLTDSKHVRLAKNPRHIKHALVIVRAFLEAINLSVRLTYLCRVSMVIFLHL